MEYYSAIKTNVAIGSTWMHLENITLSEISQTKANTVWYHLYVESKNNWNEHICRNIYRQRKQIYNYQWGEGRVEGQIESMRLADTNYYV